jgi:hypothetical protein
LYMAVIYLGKASKALLYTVCVFVCVFVCVCVFMCVCLRACVRVFELTCMLPPTTSNFIIFSLHTTCSGHTYNPKAFKYMILKLKIKCMYILNL